MKAIKRFIVLTAVISTLAVTLAIALAPRQPSGTSLPSDAEIRDMLVERINGLAGPEDGIGIVVGIMSPQGKRVISYGHFSTEDPRPLDGNTVFEIASITKVFTALLLADMIEKGEVTLTDSVVKYLATGVKLPVRNNRSITLEDLATHTSGLPFMPSGDIKSATDLYRYLAGYELTRDIGATWDYSNIGYWLLGEALASRAHVEYEKLLRT